MTQELTDLPKRIRILGEDLVAYRDKSGTYGLLHLHCSHRNASLEFGVIEERGLRCCYHGWLYDADGTILEMPAQAMEGKSKVCHGAYPVVEYKRLFSNIFSTQGLPSGVFHTTCFLQTFLLFRSSFLFGSSQAFL